MCRRSANHWGSRGQPMRVSQVIKERPRRRQPAGRALETDNQAGANLFDSIIPIRGVYGK